ncbi:hypothetical protein RIF29_42434 [Crotalaria pallida]|uniref:PORR domain-containing protein n=1 Tax=Crotalaria pallida TaxID=3830 RepID=A0AAN9E6X6_CROPI
MIHRYPSIFKLFTIPWPPTPLNATKLYLQLCVRLTPVAAALATEELNFQTFVFAELDTKLQNILMLSMHNRLLLSKLVHLATDLGLPPNFRSRLCNDYPDKFKIVDTSYGRALELVSWDLSLAKQLSPPAFNSPGLIVERPLKFNQLRLRKGLTLKRRHQDFLLKFEEMPEVCPYTNPADSLDKELIEAEKRACALVREVLGMTIEKRTLVDHLTHFRKEFGLSNKLRGMILRHPELFYVSLKGQQDSVFLVERFGEKGDLLEKHEILVLQNKWMDLARESKRMRRERRKGRIKDVDGPSYSNECNEDDSDDDDLDFEAQDDDHLSMSVENWNGEFWTAVPSPIQHDHEEQVSNLRPGRSTLPNPKSFTIRATIADLPTATCVLLEIQMPPNAAAVGMYQFSSFCKFDSRCPGITNYGGGSSLNGGFDEFVDDELGEDEAEGEEDALVLAAEDEVGDEVVEADEDGDYIRETQARKWPSLSPLW